MKPCGRKEVLSCRVHRPGNYLATECFAYSFAFFVSKVLYFQEKWVWISKERALRTAGTWRSGLRSSTESLMYRCAAHERKCSTPGYPYLFYTLEIATFAHSLCKPLYAKHPAPAYNSPTHSSVCIVLRKIQKKCKKT